MNPRIQELARQAGAQHRLNLGVEEFCFEHHELEKFAELIVANCVKIIESWAEDDFAINGIAIEILDHFDMELEE